jgi:superfamily II DNA/RNA helicase
MPPEITRLTEQFLQNPVRVEVSRPASTATNITQTLVKTGITPEQKRATLRHLIRTAEGFKNAIIFCNRKRDVHIVYRSLEKHGFSVGALHGDLDQRARMAALDAFRNDQIQLLVCSDVAARGLDIPDVSHVINYDAPHHSEDYVHRIGRTGRAGKSGVALTIVTRADQKAIDEIEKLIGNKLTYAEGPAETDEVNPEALVEVARERVRGKSERSDARTARGGRFRERAEDRSGRRSEAPRKEKVEAPRAAAVARSEPPARAETPRHAAPRPSARAVAPPRSQPKDEGREERTVGLGDHVPMFLLRPTFARRPAPAPVDAED